MDTAAQRPVAPNAPAIRALGTVVGSLPEHRLGLPLLLTVARLNRVKGIPQLVEAWAGAPELLESFNLLIVGGDLESPTPEEWSVIAEIEAVCARLPGARKGLVLLGQPATRRGGADSPRRAHGIPGLAAPGGVYACPSRKGGVRPGPPGGAGAGLRSSAPTVAARRPTSKTGSTGFLADTTDLESLRTGLARAASARLDPTRAARARSLVQKRFTVGAMADRLVSLYASVTGEAALHAA